MRGLDESEALQGLCVLCHTFAFMLHVRWGRSVLSVTPRTAPSCWKGGCGGGKKEKRGLASLRPAQAWGCAGHLSPRPVPCSPYTSPHNPGLAILGQRSQLCCEQFEKMNCGIQFSSAAQKHLARLPSRTVWSASVACLL